MTKKTDGIWINGRFMPNDPMEALAAMSRMTGGIPGFAQDILKQHLDPAAVERADEEGRKTPPK